MKKVFVTVGTTKFPKLVNTITQLPTLKALSHLGYGEIQIQTGREFDSVNIDPKLEATIEHKPATNTWTVLLPDINIAIQYNPYFEDFEGEIRKADLVISHAGAGSCLDILNLGKPLIVVINEDLMDNHQEELAYQLQKDGYAYFCSCDNLSSTLCKGLTKLRPYPKADDRLFANYLDKCCGFEP